jgi:hypothetical protein
VVVKSQKSKINLPPPITMSEDQLWTEENNPHVLNDAGRSSNVVGFRAIPSGKTLSPRCALTSLSYCREEQVDGGGGRRKRQSEGHDVLNTRAVNECGGGVEDAIPHVKRMKVRSFSLLFFFHPTNQEFQGIDLPQTN